MPRENMTKTGETVQFYYNDEGLRVRKVSTSGGTTEYTLHGKQIVHMTNGTNELHFYYGSDGKPAFVRLGSAWYAYVYNLQGDVIALTDSSGTVVVEYRYDAWGKLLATTGTLASSLGKLNPFRYRGYVYDEETGLYYLRSRYYRAEWCRLVNEDAAIEENLYRYCCNQSTVSQDPDGEKQRNSLVMKEMSLYGESTAFGLLVMAAAFIVSENRKKLKGYETVQKKVIDATTHATPIKDKDDWYDCSLYTLTRPGDPDYLYIGITNDPIRREKEHQRKRGKDIRLTVLKTGLTKNQARVAEAASITACTLQCLQNSIRSISPAKLYRYEDVMKTVWDFEDMTTDFMALDTR